MVVEPPLFDVVPSYVVIIPFVFTVYYVGTTIEALGVVVVLVM